jgi:hypothetical protein
MGGVVSSIPGITTAVETKVTHWRRLGVFIAEQADSDQQAEFLAGLAEAMVDQQVPWIAVDVAKSNARDTVLDFLQHLAGLIEATS